jgi:predicted protein tyrosine phosphatase
MISQITNNLYIGEYLDVVGETPQETAKKIQALQAEGINHIVSLCSEGIEDHQILTEKQAYPKYVPIQLHHTPVPISQVSTSLLGRTDPFKFGLELAVYEVHGILYMEPNAKILVHCTAGIDRSPFVVASYLVRYCMMSLADAYQLIKKVRPFVCEHPEWAWWIRAEPKQVSRIEVSCVERQDKGDKE